MTWILLAVIFIPMLVEARVAAINERGQFSRGGIEPAGDVYRIMRITYPGIFLAMIIEGVWRRPWPSVVVAGAVVFAAAKVLKWWAIASLGDAWTFRVVVRPGMPRIASGPYRWLRHPNYVAVVGELLGAALMSGALITGPWGTVLFGFLMFRRISVEERALGACSR